MTTLTTSNLRGDRVDELTRFALVLLKGGMDDSSIEYHLSIYGVTLEPKTAPEMLAEDMTTAIRHANLSVYGFKKNITGEVRDFIMTTFDNFSTTNVYQVTTMTTRQDKKKVTSVLSRFVQEGFIERVGNVHGVYRRVEKDAEKIDFENASTDCFKLFWPFNLHKMVKLHPKSIAIIAGEPNTGKTAFCLNVARANMYRDSNNGIIKYLSSEMGAVELKERLQGFEDMQLSEWRGVDFRERSGKFADLIEPDGITIIDFMEILDNFWLIGQEIQKVFDKLKNGVAIIAIQKDPKAGVGRGGTFGLEKPRLYLNIMDNAPAGAILQIRKAKNWVDKFENPNGKQLGFKIRNGCNLSPVGDWYYPTKGGGK